MANVNGLKSYLDSMSNRPSGVDKKYHIE